MQRTLNCKVTRQHERIKARNNRPHAAWLQVETKFKINCKVNTANQITTQKNESKCVELFDPHGKTWLCSQPDFAVRPWLCSQNLTWLCKQWAKCDRYTGLTLLIPLHSLAFCNHLGCFKLAIMVMFCCEQKNAKKECQKVMLQNLTFWKYC